MYEVVSNDNDLINIYKQIDKLEDKHKLWAHHGLSHVQNVVKTTINVLKQLDYNKELIDATLTAAFLHDLGCINGKDNHAEKSYEIVKDYFARKNISFKYKKDVLMAIKYHNNYRYLKNRIAPILRFADKLDITKERVAKEGYKIKGMKEYQYIDKIDVVINDLLIIKFTVEKHFNKHDFEEFYFTKKAVKAVEHFAKYINKNYKIFINDELWQVKDNK